MSEEREVGPDEAAVIFNREGGLRILHSGDNYLNAFVDVSAVLICSQDFSEKVTATTTELLAEMKAKKEKLN